MQWSDLNMSERDALMKLYLKNGITSLSAMKEHYNSYATGGSLEDKNVHKYQTDRHFYDGDNPNGQTLDIGPTSTSMRLLGQRIDEMQRRLNSGNSTISQVSTNLGFNQTPQQIAFAREFKRIQAEQAQAEQQHRQEARQKADQKLRDDMSGKNGFWTAVATGLQRAGDPLTSGSPSIIADDAQRLEDVGLTDEANRLRALSTAIGLTGLGAYTLPTAFGAATNVALNSSRTALGAAGKMMLPSTWTTAAGLSSGIGTAADAAMFTDMVYHGGKNLLNYDNWQSNGRYNNDNWGGWQGGANLLLDLASVTPVFRAVKGGVGLVNNTGNAVKPYYNSKIAPVLEDTYMKLRYPSYRKVIPEKRIDLIPKSQYTLSADDLTLDDRRFVRNVAGYSGYDIKNAVIQLRHRFGDKIFNEYTAEKLAKLPDNVARKWLNNILADFGEGLDVANARTNHLDVQKVKKQFQNLVFGNAEILPEFQSNIKITSIPSEAEQVINNQVFPRMALDQDRRFLLESDSFAESFVDDFQNGLKGKHYIIDENVWKSDPNHYQNGAVARGEYVPGKHRILLPEQYKLNNVVHEDIHEMEQFVGRTDSEKKLLQNYGSVEYNEQRTSNSDARMKVLQKMGVSQRASLEEQNRAIDNISDDDLIEVLKTANRYVKDAIKDGSINKSSLSGIREAMKKVGAITGIIGTGAPLLNNNKN